MKLIEHIPHGRENAIAMRELSERLNIDPRTLRALIQQERERGEPICSDWERSGYFLPARFIIVSSGAALDQREPLLTV